MQEIVDALATNGPIVLASVHGSAHPNAQGLTIYFPRGELLPEQACKEVPDPGDRACGFDNPFPSLLVYAKDPTIRAPILNRPPAEATHPRPQIPGLRFPAATKWDEFVHRYYKPVADACIEKDEGCVKSITVPVGTTVFIHGFGSSDSDDRPARDDPAHPFGIPHFYWDTKPAQDEPPLLPVYVLPPAKVDGDDCTEDCDRDGVDGPDDDPNLKGRRISFTCTPAGTYPIRLIVWDDHHDEGSLHGEETHVEHWNVHDDIVTVECTAKTEETPGIVITPTGTPGIVITPTETAGIVITPTPSRTPTPTPTSGLTGVSSTFTIETQTFGGQTFTDIVFQFTVTGPARPNSFDLLMAEQTPVKPLPEFFLAPPGWTSLLLHDPGGTVIGRRFCGGQNGQCTAGHAGLQSGTNTGFRAGFTGTIPNYCALLLHMARDGQELGTLTSTRAAGCP